MAINMVFDIFITDEYGVENKATIETSNYTEDRTASMLYNVCEFVLTEFPLPTALSQDGVLRVRVEREIETTSFSDLYMIDDIKMLDKARMKVTCKTEGALLFEPYSHKMNTTLNHATYNDTIAELLGDTSFVSYLPTIPNSTLFYNVSNITKGSAITTLCKKLGIDFSVRGGQVILELFKRIYPHDEPIELFTQQTCTNVTSTLTKSTGVGIYEINIDDDEVTSESSIVIRGTSPHPVRPATVRQWTDPSTGDEYTIIPTTGKIELLYNPINEAPVEILGYDLNEVLNHFVVEEFTLVEEKVVTLSGGIRSIAGMTVYDNVTTPATDFVAPVVATDQLDNGNDESDVLVISAIPSTDLSTANGTEVIVEDSGVDQAISSTISGTGTDEDPYIYTVILGSQENVSAEVSTAVATITSTYSFSDIIETLNLVSDVADSSLNGHLIKIDGTGVTATSGHAYSAGETVFYLDPTQRYNSVAEAIYLEILNSSLPYSATKGTINSTVQLTPKNSIDTVATFANGVDEVYQGQRDNQAIASFINTDVNVDGILVSSISYDVSNPIQIPYPIVLEGGIGSGDDIIDMGTYVYEPNHNIIAFDENVSGTLRIAYFTNAYTATIPNSQSEYNLLIKARLLDAEESFIYSVECVDYFPLSYVFDFIVGGVWGDDDDFAKNREVQVYSVAEYTGEEVLIETLKSDYTGYIGLWMKQGYGQYALHTEGKLPKYIRFYANMYSISDDKILMDRVIDYNEDDNLVGGC